MSTFFAESSAELHSSIILPTPEARIFSATSSPCHHRSDPEPLLSALAESGDLRASRAEPARLTLALCSSVNSFPLSANPCGERNLGSEGWHDHRFGVKVKSG